MTTNKGGGDGRGGGGNSGEVTAVPPKLARTEAFPFRMLSHPVGTENGLGPTYWNGTSGGMLGGSDICTYDGVPATSARSLQPFPISTPVRSPAGIMASFRYPFTSAQWQELERQALIYKCMIASVPIPPELLIPRNAPAALPSQPPHLATQAAGSCFNLRFSNNADPEPGRCRRTDGKKWRCSRDVAPDQKYCERHMHRGRPRSRKPVEVQPQSNRNARSNPSTNASSLIAGSLAANSTFPNLPTTSSAAAASQQLSSGLCARKLPPYQNTVVPSALPVDREPRYLEWMKGQPDWQLMEEEAKMGLRSGGEGGNDDPAVLQPPQYEDHLINLNFSSNFGNGASEPYLNSDLSGMEDSNIQRGPPRRFIDAWSISSAAPRDTPAAAAVTPKIINSKSVSLSSSGKVLPMSSLTLSMPSGNDEDLDRIQMGLSVTDSEERQSGGCRPKYWSSGSSLPWLVSPPLGGPLGEVLQSSTTAAGSNSASPHGSCGGLNLMTSERWGEEGSSPRERSPARVVSSSSPTGVLQKTLASLSDSSGSSSPTFGAAAAAAAATKSECPALQWPLNNRTKFPSS